MKIDHKIVRRYKSKTGAVWDMYVAGVRVLEIQVTTDTVIVYAPSINRWLWSNWDGADFKEVYRYRVELSEKPLDKPIPK